MTTCPKIANKPTPIANRKLLAIRNSSLPKKRDKQQTSSQSPKKKYARTGPRDSRSRQASHRVLSSLARLVLHDVTRHSAGCDRQRACQIHLSRPAASGKIAVLRADDDLVWTAGHSRPCVDARATTWLNHARAGFFENLEIALALRILARFLRSELDPEFNARSDALSLASARRRGPRRTCPCLRSCRRCRCRRRRSRWAPACADRECISRCPDRRAWRPSA